jgi:2,4-dienoyl-CoA reductase-like NADH-dependent reductase (Old Yellow Enzyme family)
VRSKTGIVNKFLIEIHLDGNLFREIIVACNNNFPEDTMIEVPPILRSPAPIGPRTAPNRFLAQPMEGNDGENGGCPSERTVSRYAALGRGRWGVAVVEAISVVTDCLARVNQLIIDPKNLDGFKRLVGAYKEANPDGILLFQITHSGRKGIGGTVPTTLTEPVPSGARLLKTEEIDDIRRRFVAAARLAEQAGADGIDFKMCHGYFGAEMLRPANVRADGGAAPSRTAPGSCGRAPGDPRRFRQGRIFWWAPGFPSTRSAGRLRHRRGGPAGGGPLGDEARGGADGFPGDGLRQRVGGYPRGDLRDHPAGSPGPVVLPEHIRYSKTVSETLAAARAAGGRGRPVIVQSAYSILKADALALAAECVERGYSDFAGFGRQEFADPETPAKLMGGRNPAGASPARGAPSSWCPRSTTGARSTTTTTRSCCPRGRAPERCPTPRGK